MAHPPHLPRETACGDTRTRVLLAVLWQRRPTVRSVAEEVDCSTSIAFRHLEELELMGLVTRDRGRQLGRRRGRMTSRPTGTLRPLVEDVPFGASRPGGAKDGATGPTR